MHGAIRDLGYTTLFLLCHLLDGMFLLTTLQHIFYHGTTLQLGNWMKVFLF